MTRVCALNNYPLTKMLRLSRGGAIPRQHVWGVDGLLACGHDVDFAPFHEPDAGNRLDRASKRLKGALGQLDQEAYAARRLRHRLRS